jgi:hypothetical protein
MASHSNDPRRHRPITIKWLRGGLIGQLLVGTEFWGAIEWSKKRNAWLHRKLAPNALCAKRSPSQGRRALFSRRSP